MGDKVYSLADKITLIDKQKIEGMETVRKSI